VIPLILTGIVGFVLIGWVLFDETVEARRRRSMTFPMVR